MQEVSGSIPLSSTKSSSQVNSVRKEHCGAIAQLGERLHGMQEVSGSIPLSSTKIRTLAFTRGFLFFSPPVLCKLFSAYVEEYQIVKTPVIKRFFPADNLIHSTNKLIIATRQKMTN